MEQPHLDLHIVHIGVHLGTLDHTEMGTLEQLLKGLHSAHCTVHSAQCTVHSAQCTVHTKVH